MRSESGIQKLRRAGLKKAIHLLAESDQKYISPEVASALKENNHYEIDDFDILIIRHLSLGTPQDNITETFKELGIKPNSKSTIEKRIAKLKTFLKQIILPIWSLLLRIWVLFKSYSILLLIP